MRRVLKLILIIVNVACGALLIASGLSSYLNAGEHPTIVIAAMSFPIWLVAALIILMGDFFVMRKWCLWMLLCIAVTLPLSVTVLPLNIPHGKVPERLEKTSWTLLSYNISNFIDVTGKYAGNVNPALSYILKTDADVVVIPEGRYFKAIRGFRTTQEQIDSVNERYPYVFVGNDITLFSKFPADTVRLNSFPGQYFRRAGYESKVGCYILDIYGQKTAIFGCHLRSLGLTRGDKNAYEDLTRGEGLTSSQDITELRRDVITKISRANLSRAKSVRALINAIDSLGCETTIVCGDFNDTPGCYALNELEKNGFREVYPLLGNGYMYTYNSDRLLFQIDHVLFRGAWRPWNMKRGSVKTSDHYPLLTTFVAYP